MLSPKYWQLGEEGGMRVQLAQQAKEILGQSDLVMITERVDDVALLIGQMVKMGLPEVLDRHIPRHWTQRGLSWGWTAVIWLAYIVTEGDHRKVSVETYLKGVGHRVNKKGHKMGALGTVFDAHIRHYSLFRVSVAFWGGRLRPRTPTSALVGPNPTSLLPGAISLAETVLRPFS
jgi:hypothetical protein